MKFKKFVKKAANFVLNSQDNFVNVEVGKIIHGKILNNKNILITGGGKGIGFAIAKRCVEEGAKVVISGRNEQALKEAVKQLGDNAKYLVFDVKDFEGIDNFISKAKKLLNNRIDCLVNNAGISLHEGNFRKVTLEGFEKQFDINLKGSYFIAKCFIEMKEKENMGANILFITSETGSECCDIPYGLTKNALTSLVGALSRRVYKSGIRVNGLAPGVTLSDMTKDYAPAEKGNMSRNNAAGRILLPEEIAEVSVFMLSKASECISEEIIHCNGGNHLKTTWD